MIEVLDSDGFQCAEFRASCIKLYIFAEILYEMALYYNGALLCIERASAGITIIEKVRDTFKYVNMMCYKSFDAKGKTVRKWGWETSQSSRPKMINSFVELFETGGMCVNSKGLLREMKLFQSMDGKMCAISGHDDCVMAMALAIVAMINRVHYGRPLKKAMQNRSDLIWYQEEIRKTEHMQRINMVSDIDSYLLREHKVLQRPNFNFKDKEFQTAKIILQTVKMIINFHTSYTVGNPISFTEDKELVELMERVYHKGQFTKQDYGITTQLMKYGNAWEYIYLQDNKIKSKVFINDECYSCYDDRGNYYVFIEYWRDKDSGAEYHTIYYPDKVETYIDNELTDTHTNLTGLPIHYKSMVPSVYTQFGEPFINDLIPIIDQIENLLSKLDDAVTTLSLNPMGILTGRAPDEQIDSNMVGACITLDEGVEFKYATVTMDHANIK